MTEEEAKNIKIDDISLDCGEWYYYTYGKSRFIRTRCETCKGPIRGWGEPISGSPQCLTCIRAEKDLWKVTYGWKDRVGGSWTLHESETEARKAAENHEGYDFATVTPP